MRTRDIADDDVLLQQIKLDPARQLIGAQCSGMLLLPKLGLIGDLPACTDIATKPSVIEAGVERSSTRRFETRCELRDLTAIGGKPNVSCEAGSEQSRLPLT
jgi:hypothetical protein